MLFTLDIVILFSAIANASSSILLYSFGRSEFVMRLNPFFLPFFSNNSLTELASTEVQATISLIFLNIPSDCGFSATIVALNLLSRFKLFNVVFAQCGMFTVPLILTTKYAIANHQPVM